jgi:hypothetical protein
MRGVNGFSRHYYLGKFTEDALLDVENSFIKLGVHGAPKRIIS